MNNRTREASGALKIYNSLTAKKEAFEPRYNGDVPLPVTMYVCGLTPQQDAHLGHGLTALRFDVIRRYLDFNGLQVSFLQNVTDVDDKILARAEKTGEDPRHFTRKIIESYYRDLEKLDVLRPGNLVWVTEELPRIIAYIEELIAQGFAYATGAGNVYFAVAKKSDYGKLSGQKVTELMEGVRKEIEDDKREFLDFALWKSDPEGMLSVDSPWGRGRPGWHIECSSIIRSSLGPQIDIHGGGLDLKFPHHENEIAQSEACTGVPLARYWMHTGLLTIDGQKMSKSLNNFVTLSDAIERFGARILRFTGLRFHYRSNIDLSHKLFRDNLNTILEFYRLFERLDRGDEDPATLQARRSDPLTARFADALDNDFNTPEALVVLETARNEVKTELGGEAPAGDLARKIASIRALGKVLGLFEGNLEQYEEEALRVFATLSGHSPISRAELYGQLERRFNYRQEKKYQDADEARKTLATHGIEPLDQHGKLSWRFTV